MRILFVCTANICRSPMAAALLQSELTASGIAADVRSAGIRALDGERAAGPVITAMGEHGIDLRQHVARQLTPDAVASADVVLGLTREHTREAAVSVPGALERCFTLKELVRRASSPTCRYDVELNERVHLLAADRDVLKLLGVPDDDDVQDPINRPYPVVQAAAREIAELTKGLVRNLWGVGHR